jgi:hypothetical protein
MKTKFLIGIFLLFSLILKSQNNEVEKKPTYFGLDFLKLSLIDSLKIPYLSIPERNGINGHREKIEVDEIKLANFNKFFNNNEFVFTPNKNTPSIDFNTFFRYYVFSTEYDKTFFSMLEYFNYDIIGSSTIELKESKSDYKTVQIIEYRYNNTNTYGTMILFRDENNLMKYAH